MTSQTKIKVCKKFMINHCNKLMGWTLKRKHLQRKK